MQEFIELMEKTIEANAPTKQFEKISSAVNAGSSGAFKGSGNAFNRQ